MKRNAEYGFCNVFKKYGTRRSVIRAALHLALGRMAGMMERHPLIGDVCGLGLFLGIELVKDRTTGERATEEAEAVMYAAPSRGLSFKLTMGNILTLTPALTITREEMDRALDIIEACLTKVEQGA